MSRGCPEVVARGGGLWFCSLPVGVMAEGERKDAGLHGPLGMVQPSGSYAVINRVFFLKSQFFQGLSFFFFCRIPSHSWSGS